MAPKALVASRSVANRPKTVPSVAVATYMPASEFTVPIVSRPLVTVSGQLVRTSRSSLRAI